MNPEEDIKYILGIHKAFLLSKEVMFLDGRYYMADIKNMFDDYFVTQRGQFLTKKPRFTPFKEMIPLIANKNYYNIFLIPKGYENELFDR
jgi:hypothetical protein